MIVSKSVLCTPPPAGADTAGRNVKARIKNMNMLKCLLINLKRYLYISKHYYWIILPIVVQEDMNDSECFYPNIVRIM